MAFCDSPYLRQENYAETLADLVTTFYYFKNETLDRLTDDELLGWMRSRFANQCRGSIELLQQRELEILARAIRYGFDPENAHEAMEAFHDDARSGDRRHHEDGAESRDA